MKERASNARLLDWLLDPDGRDEATRAWLESDPEARRRLAELETFLGRVREVARAEEAGSRESDAAANPESHLADAVLERTTREDLSWRGDLRVVGGYLRRRLAESSWLKLAAASLLVHLIALPALAVYVFVARPDRPELGFIPWEEHRPPALPEAEPEPVPELPVPRMDEEELDELLEEGR